MPQGAKIHVLPLGFRRIAGRARHPCREVLDRQNIVMGLQHLLEQGEQVQPFPGRFLERPVIEIEPVDIDESAHRFPPKKQGPPKRPRALRSKPQGVFADNLAPVAMKVKSRAFPGRRRPTFIRGTGKSPPPDPAVMHYSPRSRSTLFGARAFSASGPDTRSGVFGPLLSRAPSRPASRPASRGPAFSAPIASSAAMRSPVAASSLSRNALASSVTSSARSRARLIST